MKQKGQPNLPKFWILSPFFMSNKTEILTQYILVLRGKKS